MRKSSAGIWKLGSWLSLGVARDEVNCRPFELEVLHHQAEKSSRWHCKFKVWKKVGLEIESGVAFTEILE